MGGRASRKRRGDFGWSGRRPDCFAWSAKVARQKQRASAAAGRMSDASGSATALGETRVPPPRKSEKNAQIPAKKRPA